MLGLVDREGAALGLCEREGPDEGAPDTLGFALGRVDVVGANVSPRAEGLWLGSAVGTSDGRLLGTELRNEVGARVSACTDGLEVCSTEGIAVGPVGRALGPRDAVGEGVKPNGSSITVPLASIFISRSRSRKS